MTLYKVVYNNNLPFFESECERFLREGWTPQGGISVNNGVWFAQAFVK